MSAFALSALFLLPLFHPIADLTNWQRIAAFEKDRALLEPAQGSAVFRRIITTYAVETPLITLFMCMLGAIAVTATETAADGDVIRNFVQQLTSQQNEVADGALCLLLVSIFAAVLSTMSSAFSAVLCAIRYDILPAFSPEPVAGPAQGTEKAAATRGSIIAACGLYLATAVAFYIANAHLRVSFASGDFLALLFAFYCTQLSFVPLIVGPIIGRTGEGFGTVSAGRALVILGLGSAIGIGAVIIYLATRDERWLWAAVPACLGSGFFVFAIARLWPAQAARAG
jgi:Na+/proline symporter